jgi:hypothetical protein
VRESLVDVRIYITPLEEDDLLVPTSGQFSIDRRDPGSYLSSDSVSSAHFHLVPILVLPKIFYDLDETKMGTK